MAAIAAVGVERAAGIGSATAPWPDEAASPFMTTPVASMTAPLPIAAKAAPEPAEMTVASLIVMLLPEPLASAAGPPVVWMVMA